MSAVIETKQALTAAMAALPEMAGVQVTYGDQVARPRKERVFLGDVEAAESEPTTMRYGKVRMAEEFSVRLIVTVDSKKGHEATEVRAMDLLKAVYELLATDPKLASAPTPPPILWATPESFRLVTSLVSEAEHRTQIEADISVKARNT